MKGIINVPVADVHFHNARTAEVVTQAVFATEVIILEEKDGWYQIKIPIQHYYSGWVKKEEVFLGKPPKKFEGKIIIKTHLTELKSLPHENSKNISKLTVNTRLWVTERQKNWYAVWLPGGGKGWVKAEDGFWEGPAAVRGNIRVEDILKTAREFLGVPYLWGGITPYGIDCSGLAYAIFAVHGYYLHRDADLQYRFDGYSVNIKSACPGDLVFFHSGEKESPSHVGIYEGYHIFINASSSKNGVVRDSLKEMRWYKALSGIKRILE